MKNTTAEAAASHSHRADPDERTYRTVKADKRYNRDGRRSVWDCRRCERTVSLWMDASGLSNFKHDPR